MNLHDARVTVETMLEIVSSERRADGGWILWHDPNALNGIPGSLAEHDEIWARIDAAIKALDAAGWLQYRGDLITVVPTDGGCGDE